MSTADNAEGFAASDLELLNAAAARLMATGLDEKSASDAVNNNWSEGSNTVDSLCSVRCDCGTHTGVRCEYVAPADTGDWVTLEVMPDHLRGSHRAAGGFGSYPHNGSLRLRVYRECADEIVAEDRDGYSRLV